QVRDRHRDLRRARRPCLRTRPAGRRGVPRGAPRRRAHDARAGVRPALGPGPGNVGAKCNGAQQCRNRYDSGSEYCFIGCHQARVDWRAVAKAVLAQDWATPRMIEFRSVSKVFPDGTVAVDEFDLVIPSRKTTVLVGSSGSGKTTL